MKYNKKILVLKGKIHISSIKKFTEFAYAQTIKIHLCQMMRCWHLKNFIQKKPLCFSTKKQK